MMAKRKTSAVQPQAEPIGWKFIGAQPGRAAPGVPRRDISLQEAQRKGLVEAIVQRPDFYQPVYAQGALDETED